MREARATTGVSKWAAWTNQRARRVTNEQERMSERGKGDVLLLGGAQECEPVSDCVEE